MRSLSFHLAAMQVSVSHRARCGLRARMILSYLVLLVLSAFAQLSVADDSPAPQADRGVLNAPAWNFAQTKPLEISGEWQVVWGQLLDPSMFEQAYTGEYFTLPARWNKVEHPAMQGTFGAATFRVRLQLPQHSEQVAYHMIAPHSAYRLFINGELVVANGVVGVSADEQIANYVSRQFPGVSGDSEIVLQASNFTHAYGGPGHPLKLYDAQTLKQLLDTLSVVYGLVVGIIFTIGLFHLILHLADRKSVNAAVQFWFSLLCFIIVYRVQGIIPLVHEYFHDTSYWRSLRFPYASLYAAPAVYLMFFRAVFPKQFPQKLTLIPVIVSVLGLIYTLTQSEFAYTSTRDFAIWLNVFVIAYSLVFTLFAVAAKEAGARVIVVVNAVFLVTAVYDAIIYTDQSSGFDLTPFGILALGLGYSYALFLGLRARFLVASQNAESLRTVNIDLERQVAERTRDYQLEAEKAQSAASDKARFIAAASHDLRQPLHALALFTKALQQKMIGSVNAPLVERQENAIANLGNLLQDTLDAARLDKQGKEPSFVTVRSIDVRDKLIDSFVDSALSKRVALSVEADPGEFTTDPILLQRILSNLLDNAIKAAHRSVQVQITREKSAWRFSVSDDGPGITQDDIDRVFNSYVSLDEQTDGHGGYGLGLYVVKEFSQRLGGEIRVDSELERGSTFVLNLPHSLEPQGKLSVKSEYQLDWSCLHNSRILAVDDDDEILEAVEALLSDWGCEVALANSADLALAQAKEFAPDVILLDYHLQGTTGLTVKDQLECVVDRSIQIVFVTGATELNIIDKLKQTGCEVLEKPVVPIDLANAIINCLREDPVRANSA